MADRLPSMRQMAQQSYVPEDNPDYIKAQEYLSPEATWRRNYEYVLENTRDPETARIYADSIAATLTRQAITGAIPALIAGGANIAAALRGVGGGRNAMTAAEMLPKALPAPRPGPSSPIGGGATGERIYGTSAERAPRIAYEPYKPDVRSVPDEYAMFEGEGGLTSDAIAEARRLARERIAAERAFREQQLATMEGEGGGAQAAGEARARRAAADQAAYEAAMNAAQSEGMGAAIGAGRRQPGTSLVPAGSRDVVPARTAQGDLQALMDRHFGGGESGGLPARGPTYYSDLPNAGPRLIGESFAGESPAYAFNVRTNLPQAGMPDWLKYALPTSAALAGGTYLASGSSPQMTAPQALLTPTSAQGVNVPPQTSNVQPEVQGPPMPTGADLLRNPRFNAFRQAAPTVTTGGGGGGAAAASMPQPVRREEKGFLSGLMGKIYDPNYQKDMSSKQLFEAAQADPDNKGAYFRAVDKWRQENPDFKPDMGSDTKRKSGGRVDEDKTLKKALEIIHHLVKR